jgi:O-antigen/teichoic acid export membrane protein
MANIQIQNGVRRNTLWMLCGQGLRLIIQALYFVEVARSLGARNYGAFIGAVAFVGIVVPFADLGSGNLLVKNVSRDRATFAAYWGRALTSTMISGSALAVMLLLAYHFVLPATIPARLVLLVCVSDLFGLNIITTCGQAFLAFDRLNWTATINVLISASRLLGAIVLVGIAPHPSPLEWGYVYFSSTIAVSLVAVGLVCLRIGKPEINLVRATGEVREGLYFSVGLSAQTIYNDIDKTMLARLGTLEAAGIYGAAYRLIDVCFVPVSSLLMASYANFFRTGASGVGSCLAYAKPLLLQALGYAVVACAILQLCAGLVPHVLGGEYAKSTEALRWLALLPMLKVVSYFFSNILAGAGHQAVRSVVQVSVAVFNVLINLWIIPEYSWRGAAWSSLASDALLACGVFGAVLVIAHSETTRQKEVGALV